MPTTKSDIDALAQELGVKQPGSGFGGLVSDYIDNRVGRSSGDFSTRMLRALAIRNAIEEKKAQEAARADLVSGAALTGVDASPAERSRFDVKRGGFDLPLPPAGSGDFVANEQATYNTLARESGLDQAVARNQPRVEAIRRAFSLADAGIETGDVKTGALLDATNALRGNPFVTADVGNDKSVSSSELEPVSIRDPGTGNLRQVYAIRTPRGVRADGAVDFSFEPARGASGDFMDVPPEVLARVGSGRSTGGTGQRQTEAERLAEKLVAEGFFRTPGEAILALKKIGADPQKLRATLAARLAGRTDPIGKILFPGGEARTEIDRLSAAALPAPAAVSPPATSVVTATDPRTGRKLQLVNGRWQEMR